VAYIAYLIKPLALPVLRMLGTFLGFLLSYRNRSNLFFFFPAYHVGGAERVHADIVSCFSDTKPWVFFTEMSTNDRFRAVFEKHAKVIDLSDRANRPRGISTFWLSMIAGMINRQTRPVVFGCNSTFFYRLIPLLERRVRRIDLLHAFGGKFEEISLPLVQHLDCRIVVTQQTVEDYRRQYLTNGVPSLFQSKIVAIENQVSVPSCYSKHRNASQLTVLYVGRGTEEKRVHLIARAAAKCHAADVNARFVLAGDVANVVEENCRKHCHFLGVISDDEHMTAIYADADVLVLTSSREGFPMVIMEAMAHGVIPMATSVGGIPYHIKHGFNGLLLPNGDEDEIVSTIIEELKTLAADHSVVDRLSRSAHEYARDHFNSARFTERYRQILLGSDPPHGSIRSLIAQESVSFTK
jgi:glycosyltransferase involved in cell wall biosynthesis